MQSRNKKADIPAISSASIPGSRKSAAVSSSSSSSNLLTSNVATPALEEAAKVSSPPPIPLAGWGLQSFDEEEDEGVADSKSAAAKKGSKSKQGKGRAPSKSKSKEDLDDDGEEEQLMSGTTAAKFADLPSAFVPLADAERAEDAATPKDVVHLRVQQRKGPRKAITTVQGTLILRDLKRDLCCNGIVVEDEDLGKIIQLQGDHRKCVAAFLVKAGLARKDNVRIHGY